MNLLSFVNEKFASEMAAGYCCGEAEEAVLLALECSGATLVPEVEVALFAALDALVAGLPVPAAVAAVLAGIEI